MHLMAKLWWHLLRLRVLQVFVPFPCRRLSNQRYRPCRVRILIYIITVIMAVHAYITCTWPVLILTKTKLLNTM